MDLSARSWDFRALIFLFTQEPKNSSINYTEHTQHQTTAELRKEQLPDLNVDANVLLFSISLNKQLK